MSTHEQIPSFLAEMPERALASYLNPGILPKPLPIGVATRAMTQAAAGEAEVTKTISGKRRIKLLEPAMEALVAQKAHTFLASMEVFQNPRTLERWTGDQPIRKTMWAKAVKKAGVRYRRPYQTRHTYASMMLSVGEHPMWVASQIGAQRLDNDRQSVWPLDARRRQCCWESGCECMGRTFDHIL